MVKINILLLKCSGQERRRVGETVSYSFRVIGRGIKIDSKQTPSQKVDRIIVNT
jgi:hypothetical protein